MCDEVLQIIEGARADGRSMLFEHESTRICELYQLPVTAFLVAHTRKETVEAAGEIGFPEDKGIAVSFFCRFQDFIGTSHLDLPLVIGAETVQVKIGNGKVQ